MASTVFTDNSTLIIASWLQDVNTVTYTLFGDGSSYTGNLTVGSSKFTVAASSGNTVMAGIFSTGAASTASAAAGDIVVVNAKSIRGATAANSNTFRMIGMDSNNVIQLGVSGSVPVAVPYTAAASLDAGSSILNGRIEVDSTNNRLIYYSGGNRYYIGGTSF